MVNEARISFNRLNVEFGGNTIGNTIPNDSQIDQAVTRVSFSDAAILGYGPATNSPQGRIVTRGRPRTTGTMPSASTR